MDAINGIWVALQNFERHYEGEHIILEIGDKFSVEQINKESVRIAKKTQSVVTSIGILDTFAEKSSLPI
jgi:hypothetical protein